MGGAMNRYFPMTSFVGDSKFSNPKWNERGMSLIELMLVIVISIIIMLTFASMINSQSQSQRALSEKLDAMSVHNHLLELAARSNLCSYLTGGSPLIFNSTNLSSASVPLGVLYGGSEATSPEVVKAGAQLLDSSPISPWVLANNGLLLGVELKDIAIIQSPNIFRGVIYIRTDGSRLVRPLRPILVPVTFSADISVPTSATISQCFGSQNGATKKTMFRVFTNNGSWTVPSGVTEITVEVWGGGGGGGGSSRVGDLGGLQASGGGGGGAGEYINAIFPVQSGQVLNVNVGIAGTGGHGLKGGAAGNDGGYGGDSWVSSTGMTVVAKGGSGGQGGVCIANGLKEFGWGGKAGSGGSVTGTSQFFTIVGGGGGTSGYHYPGIASVGPPLVAQATYAMGGIGGSAGGAGGSGGAPGGTSNGNYGVEPGGGGAGSSVYATSSATSGYGGKGRVIIHWQE